MKINKFVFMRDILQSPEWQDDVVGMNDAKQFEYIEALYDNYKANYVVHNYNANQFFEEYLQLRSVNEE